ncbi:MAG: hypothetical protein UW05_C0026G0006 [Candidatus Giovannonibacteria bacterium GW2011_GWC2_43_8]|nr:MAG: hypothetical protein UW05_C0026G0006 [Candidatus Giovannonibacteria bacterium GW2011_GWC2_43_8]
MVEEFKNKDRETTSTPERSSKISLPDILVYENPNRGKYQEIIKSLEARVARNPFGSPPDEYSEEWMRFLMFAEKIEKYPEDYRFFQEKLKVDILIDLGGGRGTNMKYFARTFGVRTYIDVERYLSKDLPVDPFKDLSEKFVDQPENMQILVVQADMLDFISRLPDNFANFNLNGIDSLVIEDPEYHYALAKELVRTTKKGGIVFGINSDALYSLGPAMKQFEREYKKDDRLVQIFEKV